ncbi:GxxExxY protein [Sulfurisphaera ohwakuensis]|uniref:GxxExxY protein n=1 Tax=Sulfurisphaera ohwakuensis TaxID=69656 RepID=UPI0036F3A3F2
MGRKAIVISNNFSGPDVENSGRLLFYSNVMDLLISNDFTYNGVNYLNPLLEMPIGSKRADFAIVDSHFNLRLLLEFKELEHEVEIDRALKQVINYSRIANPMFYGVIGIIDLGVYKHIFQDPSLYANMLIRIFDSDCLQTECKPVYAENKRVYEEFPHMLEDVIKVIFNIISGKVRGKVRSYVRNEAFYQYELARILTQYGIKVYPEYMVRLMDKRNNITIPARIDLVLKIEDNLIPVEVKSYEVVSQEQLEQLMKYMKLLELPLGYTGRGEIVWQFKSPLGVAANPEDGSIRLTVIDELGNKIGEFSVSFVKKGENIYLPKNEEIEKFIEFIRSRA